MKHLAARLTGALLALVLAIPAVVAEDGIRLLSSQGLSAEHVALLMSEQQGGDLVFEQVASIVPLAEGAPGVGLWIEVDGDGLLAETVPERMFLKLTVYVLQGTLIVHSTSRAFEISRPARLLEADGIRITGGFVLEPGSYRIRVLISDPESGRVGIREDVVEVPAAGGTAISALAFSGLSVNWLDVALDGLRPPPGFAPSALAVIPVASSWFATVLVRGTENLALENGSAMGPDAVQAGSWSFAPEVGGWKRATVEIAPASELTGRFEMAPVALTAAEGRRQTFGDDFVVQQQGEANLLRGGIVEVLLTSQVAEATSWTRVKRNTEVASTAPVYGDSSRGRRLAISKSKAREGLLSALNDYANGDRQAMRRLADLENEAMGGSADALAALADLELRTFASIQQRRSQAVVPILDLYLRRYTNHLERREYFLATHCKRMALAIAEQAATAAEPELQPALADFLTAMGARQVAANDPNGAVSLLSALELAPGHQAALEVLVWHLERSGQYEDLAEIVDGLQDPPPLVVLRRTLAAVRLGQAGSIEQLADLARRGDWLGELAAQELVRSRLLEGRSQEALEALNEALTRFPDSRKLGLLKALLHDLDGQPVESLAAMTAIGPAGEVGARHRYARDPDEMLAELQRRLTERASADVESLREVLKTLT